MRFRPSVLVIAALLACGLPVRAEDASNGQKAPEHKNVPPDSYVRIEPIYTTIVTGNHAAGMLMVAGNLDVPDAKLRQEVTRSLPVLRDAYIRNLMAFSVNVARVDTPPDRVLIAQRLQGVTDRALKKPGAKVRLDRVAIRAKTH